MEKKLEVKNLQISFRTQGGILKAVRNISFDLYKGETLAIVGESGSGKSVTSKAVMGILAGNGMIESGKIIYDGKDLVRIPEEEMVKALSGMKGVVVMDKAEGYSALGGPLGADVKAALFGRTNAVVLNIVYGLGGRDVRVESIEEAYDRLFAAVEAGGVPFGYDYLGLRK